MTVGRLLIDDYPIQVLPKLAEEIGLNEAIILQQIHYWLNGKNAHVRDGKRWVYNTYDGWREQFPFWSLITVKRAFGSLEKKGLLLTANYNKAGFDKTKWYSIDYTEVKRVSQRTYQNDTTSVSNRYDGTYQNDTTNTIDYTETTTETTKYIVGQTPDRVPSETYQVIITYLNDKANTSFRHTSKTTKAKIKARLKDGFTVDDFKKVIDNKVSEWLNDKEMCKYLRPETLFGTKFESYLNQKSEITRIKEAGYEREHTEADEFF